MTLSGRISPLVRCTAWRRAHELKKGILTVTCPDSAGIIGTVTSFLHMHGANIEDCQSNSTPGNVFSMRVHFSLPEHWLSVVREAFGAMIARPYGMEWAIKWEDEAKRVAILCTKEDHALMEMLWGVARRDLRCDVTAVISNHTELQKATESLGFKFHHVPVSKDNKPEAEKAILDLVGDVDLVVLARYMQVLSAEFIDRAGAPIINIHHSFLPAFKGANPYRQAHEKGVRLIGATAHYVTPELDQGPIIEQDVARVDHSMSVADFRTMGRSVESKVLYRAVKWHLEDRIFRVEGNKTVVFS
uniref:Formyltetrahydrofolate deformylase n=1 Tax=Tetraselmis sp. GSL018 TaxID=582737 RepID=A0A061RW76_9CHLO